MTLVSSFDTNLQIGRKFLEGSGVVDSSVNDQKNPVLVDDFSVVILKVLSNWQKISWRFWCGWL